jgi:hypothetical protein
MCSLEEAVSKHVTPNGIQRSGQRRLFFVENVRHPYRTQGARGSW